MANVSPVEKGYFRHVQNCTHYDESKFLPFFIEGESLGWIRKDLKPLLLSQKPLFQEHQDGLQLYSSAPTFEARTQTLGLATDLIAKSYKVAMRHEMYPVIKKWGDKPLAQIDRAAIPWFGVQGFGIHVNGYVRKADGLYMWIGERAADRQVDPGKLDNMIGGGQPIGLTLPENLCKEAKEEAGLSPSVALSAQLIKSIHYKLEKNNGLRNDVLFVYDLELPSSVIPQNTDGEVAAFHLMSLAEVADLVENTNRFKFNCNLVITDFLMRHSYLENRQPEFDALYAFFSKAAIA